MDVEAIFDGMNRASDALHRACKVRALRVSIARVGKTCGDCDKWMKSRECPKERNVNGRNRGPSSGGLICGQFVESRSATKRRDQLSAELAAITKATHPEQTP